MPDLTLSLRQEAEVVTDLARGRTVSQIAARRHLPTGVVTAVAELHGADSVAWSKASRELNRRLRQESEAVDAVPGHGSTIEIEGTVSVGFGQCSWTGCGHHYADDVEPGASVLEVQMAMDRHAATHRTPPADDPTPDVPDATVPDQPAPAADTVPSAVVDDATETVVDEVPAASELVEAAPVPLAVAPGSIEFLLEEADTIGGEAIATVTSRVRELVDKLRGLIDEHYATNRRRVEILAELTDLEAREQALWAELIDLGGSYPAPDAAAAVPPATPLPASLAAGVWWQLPKEVRARIKPWAAANDVPHGKTGRQPDATVEAYLQAHPEDDPR